MNILNFNLKKSPKFLKYDNCIKKLKDEKSDNIIKQNFMINKSAQNTAYSPPHKNNAKNKKAPAAPSFQNSIQFVVNKKKSENTSLNNIINSKVPPKKGSLFYRLANSSHYHYNSVVGRSYSLNLRNDPPFIFHRDV